MVARAQRSQRSTNIWPGFVDALATLLMVIMFLLMVFVLAQFFLNEALSGRDTALDKLRAQVSELGDLLGLERTANKDLRLNLSQLSEELQASVILRDEMQSTIASLARRTETAEGDVARLTLSLEESAKAMEAANKAVEAANKTIEADKEKISLQVNELARLSGQVAALKALKEELEREITAIAVKAQDKELALKETKSALLQEKELSDSARAQVALLNRQMAALREQLGRLAALLQQAEEESVSQDVQIASLGKRLNAALATKVQELSRYRSEFFGRLREVLGNQPGVRVVGDRFVFQSEVLFASGSAEIGIEGQAQLVQLAKTLKEISSKIPKDIDWIMRIDGHTDRIPIHTAQFPSNWELSSARAISVVRLLIDQGIPADRLAAAGFGEYQPLDDQDDEIARRRNRRIELKLTQR